MRKVNIEEVVVLDEKFSINDLIYDGANLMKATPKLVEAQGLVNRREWKKVKTTKPTNDES